MVTIADISSITSIRNIYGNFDLVSKINNLKSAIVCGTLQTANVIAVVARATNKSLAGIYLPVQNAEIKFYRGTIAYGSESTLYTNEFGVAKTPCFSTLVLTAYKVKHNDVDFGKGKGVWSDVYTRATSKDVPFAITGSYYIPCDTSYTPANIAIKADSLTSLPTITFKPPVWSMPPYGNNILSTGLPFRLYINGKEVYSGKIDNPDTVSIQVNKSLSSIGATTSPINIEAIVNLGECLKKITAKVPLPVFPKPEIPCYGEIGVKLNESEIFETLSKSPTLPSGIYVPVYLTNVTGDISSTEMSVYANEKLIGSIFAGQSLNLITVLSGLISTRPDGITKFIPASTIKLVPKSKCIKEMSFNVPQLIPTGVGLPIPSICPDPKTTVDKTPSIPSVLPSTPSAPFFISVGTIKTECPSNPALTKKMTGETGTVTLGHLSTSFPIPSPGQSDGEVYFDLSKLIDMSVFVGGAPVTPTPTPTPAPTLAPVPSECEKIGKLGTPNTFLVSLSEVQSYLNKCFPGAIAEAGTGTWTGAYKITRSSGGRYPAGTYFWATTWEGIGGTY